MFDIGFWEISLIMLLALLIVGPERLPGMVSTIGNWAGRAKFMARSLRMQVERELAREVEESKPKDASAKPAESPAAKPRTPVQEAAEAAQAAQEEALEAARNRKRDVQETAESHGDDGSQKD